MNAITVYCSSSTRLDPSFHAPARIVGAEFARRDITLVYGGGGIGLMGDVARTARANDGKVVGVITHTLKDLERGYEGCDELIVVDTMRQRKQQMMQRGDGFLILPGGVGTYEELFEVLGARIVGEHNKPIGVVNTEGYYDPMIEMVRHGVEHEFIQPQVLDELLHVDPDPVKVIDRLCDAEPPQIDDDRFLPTGKTG